MFFIILAVLAAIYGTCVQSIGLGVSFGLIWYGLAALSAFHAFSLRHGIWAGIPAPLRMIFILIILAGCAAVAATWILIAKNFHEKGERNLDYIIVLGAQVLKTGPSRSLKSRLDSAAAYLKENPNTICIVSGGQGFNEPDSEARVMKDYLVDTGIPQERILTEDRSVNTAQNLAFSKRLLKAGEHRIGIVTNDFHLYRALRLASKAGYKNVTGIAAPSTPFYLPNNMLRETFGILKDALTGGF